MNLYFCFHIIYIYIYICNICNIYLSIYIYIYIYIYVYVSLTPSASLPPGPISCMTQMRLSCPAARDSRSDGLMYVMHEMGTGRSDAIGVTETWGALTVVGRSNPEYPPEHRVTEAKGASTPGVGRCKGDGCIVEHAEALLRTFLT